MSAIHLIKEISALNAITNKRGLFITFEGPDGSGKSTQLQRLSIYLKSKGLSVVTTREPGGTVISDKIREILLNPVHQEMSPQAEVLLYAASRAQHVWQKIIPALNEGRIVLCDRFVEASVAYQGFGLGFGEELIRQINHFATGGLIPDRTYLIDLDPETAKKRMSLREQSEFKQDFDRIEQKDVQYHQKVREGFHDLAQRFPERIRLLDGLQSIEAIQRVITEDLEPLLVERNAL